MRGPGCGVMVILNYYPHHDGLRAFISARDEVAVRHICMGQQVGSLAAADTPLQASRVSGMASTLSGV